MYPGYPRLVVYVTFTLAKKKKFLYHKMTGEKVGEKKSPGLKMIGVKNVSFFRLKTRIKIETDHINAAPH